MSERERKEEGKNRPEEEEMPRDRRTEYLRSLQEKMERKYQDYERKYMLDYTKKMYSEMWLRQKKDPLEQIDPVLSGQEFVPGSVESDLFLISPHAASKQFREHDRF